jgi:NADPH:quinone reductase-like Zn-dependent oxidoreductase
VGADHVVIDDDTLQDAVRAIATEGLDAVLEFVSATALPDMLALTRFGGAVCFVGALSNEWTIPNFSPFAIPNGVHLTSYAGGPTDLPAEALARYLDAIEAGTMQIVITDTYPGLDQVAAAHHDFESTHRPGKRIVVLPTR